MTDEQIGMIKQVELRSMFPNEDREFTPWLNENINILGEQLGLDIIDSSIEETVGNFRCDIFAKDSESDKNIIIENQFGSSNHDHLGKIISYGAWLDAKIVIWIAETFRKEHERALQWLNEDLNHSSELSFFGIEIRLITIDNSKPAPDFRIAVKPTNWEAIIKPSESKLTERRKKYLETFSRIVEEYSKKNTTWRKVKPSPKNWLGFGAGKSGLSFNWSFRSNNRFNVELYIDTGEKEDNERIFAKLSSYKEKVESEGLDLSWEKLDTARASRIAVYYYLKGPIHMLNETDREDLVLWASTTMDKFQRLFTKYIDEL